MTDAYLFPGQGAQAEGMGRDWCEAHPVARATFDEASEALGFARTSFYDLMERHGVRRARDLTAQEIQQARSETGSFEQAAEHLEVSASGLGRRMGELGLS